MAPRASRPCRGLSLLAAALLMPALAWGTTGTCDIVPEGLGIFSHVPSAGGFLFLAKGDVPLSFDVDVEEATGKITVKRDAIPDVTIDTQGGPVLFQMSGPAVVGTIDSAGNIALPGFSALTVFAVVFSLPINTTLATGPQAILLNGTEYVDHGTPLDFGTGVVVLSGGDIVPNAPIVSEAVISGIQVACHFNPIPSRDALPGPPVLRAFKGSAKVGSAKGDTLKINTRVVPGPAALDFANAALIVQITGASGDLARIIVRGSSLTRKGKSLVGRDTEGTVIKVDAGAKTSAGTDLPTSGSVKITTGKKDSRVKLKVVGLDLAALAGTAAVTLAAGSSVATQGVTVRGGGRKRTFR